MCGLVLALDARVQVTEFLEANRDIPPAFREQGSTEMSCIRGAMDHLHEYAYTHHIERLMLFGNLSLTTGINPQEMTDWMWSRFIDGAEWVMIPNVIGMATFADGGKNGDKTVCVRWGVCESYE